MQLQCICMKNTRRISRLGKKLYAWLDLPSTNVWPVYVFFSLWLVTLMNLIELFVSTRVFQVEDIVFFPLTYMFYKLKFYEKILFRIIDSIIITSIFLILLLPIFYVTGTIFTLPQPLGELLKDFYLFLLIAIVFVSVKLALKFFEYMSIRLRKK